MKKIICIYFLFLFTCYTVKPNNTVKPSKYLFTVYTNLTKEDGGFSIDLVDANNSFFLNEKIKNDKIIYGKKVPFGKYLLIIEPGEESFSNQWLCKKEIIFSSNNRKFNINIPIDSVEFSFDAKKMKYEEDLVIIKVEKIIGEKIIDTYCVYNFFSKKKELYSGFLHYIERGSYLLSYYNKGKKIFEKLLHLKINYTNKTEKGKEKKYEIIKYF